MLLFSVRAARTKETREKAPPQNPGGNLILDCCFLCFFAAPAATQKMKSTKVEISRCSQNEMKKQRVRLLTPDRERHLRESESFAKVAWHAQTLSAVCGSERRGEWSGYWPEAAALTGYAPTRLSDFLLKIPSPHDGRHFCVLRENPSLLSQLGTALLSGRCFICLARRRAKT